VVVLDDHANVQALDSTSGAVRWAMQHPPTKEANFLSLVAGSGVIDAGTVVGVPILDPRRGHSGLPTTSTVFVDTQTGMERWRTPSGILSSFSFDADIGLLFEYGEQRELLARDPTTGGVAWQARAPDSRVLSAGPLLFVVPDDDRKAHTMALDAATGAPLWAHDPVRAPGIPVDASNQVLLLTA
jgi:outer membrane protein assembly factor BamB